MGEIFGVSTPDIDITGMLAGSWIYILIIGFVGLIAIVAVGLILFYKVYNRKIVVFENVSGQGYQPIFKTRARIIKLGVGGEEILKTLARGKFTTAYGRKMGRNTYWFAIGQDGYWYNFLLGDLDTKMAMLDVEPVDRDVRMFNTALYRMADRDYNTKSFMEKYGNYMIAFVFLIILVLGMWMLIGAIGKATAPLAEATDNYEKIANLNMKVTERLDNIARRMGIQIDEIESSGGSGLVEA